MLWGAQRVAIGAFGGLQELIGPIGVQAPRQPVSTGIAIQDHPTRLQEPPIRRQEPPRCFNVFAFLGLLGAILAQHGLLAAPKSLHDTSKRSQDASKTLSRTSRTRPRASKLPPRASKTPPRANQNGLLQTPPADAVAVNQGWSGGGSPA